MPLWMSFAFLIFVQRNTFQCILTTDGTASFVFFLYPVNGVQWTAGDTHGNNGMA